MCIAYLWNTWQQDALQGKTNWQRQFDALDNVLLGSLESCHRCECYFDTYHLPKHCCRPCTPFWTVFPDDCGLSQQGNVRIKWFRNGLRSWMCWVVLPNSSDLNPIKQIWDVQDKLARSIEAPLHNLQGLLLTSWCQIPQHTFGDLMVPTTWRVRAVVAAEG